MTITLSMPEIRELKPKILVIGVGGAGGNAVNNMIRSQLEGVEFVVANTDAQALAISLCERRIQLGTKITEGLGAGSRPDVGAAAAEEAAEEIIEYMSGAHMAFITAGMGGGTGTGAAPVIARLARECGLLTVGVVTKPFQFEGSRRMTTADGGIEELQQFVDTLIIIPNQNLFRVANEKTTFADAFAMADNVLYSGVRGITDLMVMPGLINLDFADVRTVMSEMGKAMMGTGEAGGENRAIDAAECAIANPLLDDVSMKGARGVLINITGGPDLTLFEVDEAANRIRSEVDPEANIIVGSTFDEALDGKMRVSVFATGIDGSVIEPAERFLPSARRTVHEPLMRPLPHARPAALPQATRPVAAQMATQSLFNQDIAPALEEELDAEPALREAGIIEADPMDAEPLSQDAGQANWGATDEEAPLSLDDLTDDIQQETDETLALADDFADEADDEVEDSVEARARAALDRAAEEEDIGIESDVDLSAIEALRQRIESLTKQSDGFFSDAPEMPESLPQGLRDEPAQPEALAEADLINAGPSRGASLMERMIKRVRKEPAVREEPMELSMADAIEEAPAVAPQPAAAAAKPASRPAPRATTAPAVTQPSTERRPAAALVEDEDAFEIPAFLRRQAN